MFVGYLACAFDLLNVQDLDLIQQASHRCDELVVGVISDAVVEHTYGRRPVVPLEERLALVRHVRGVTDAVVHHGWGDCPAQTVFVPEGQPANLRPDRSQLIVEQVSLVPRRSSASTVLREALRPAEIAVAA